MHGQVTALWTNNHGFCSIFGCDGGGDAFGAPLALLGGGRFAVGVPKSDYENIFDIPPSVFPDAGQVSYFDQAGQGVGGVFFSVFGGGGGISPGEVGAALAPMAKGKLLTSSPTTGPKAGLVYLLDTNASNAQVQVILTWTNPASANAFNTFFGHTLATLPGNRFAASSMQGAGRIFLFDASQVAAPFLVITNPTPSSGIGLGIPTPPWSGSFGSALAMLGTNRLLVADPRDSIAGDNAGSVFLYDLAGNLIRTIHNSTGKADDFGASVVAVDEHRFLIGAPLKDETFVAGNLFTNDSAGAVYLYDDTGTLLRTFRAPDASRSGNFGRMIAMLGPGRILIGSPSERIGATTAGRVHLFSLEGIHLETIDNPAPASGDGFGAGIAALDERRFVIGAPGDDTNLGDAGSIYAFDAPLPFAELGLEIPRPNNLNVSGIFQAQGPSVTPAGAAFWHVPSQKLFAVKPGGILVTWPLLNGQSFNWQASVEWPTNHARFQIHIASPAFVDVGGGGAFSSTILHATTSGVDADAVRQNRIFSVANPGFSLLMLSSGDPSSNAIRFQFVRTIVWNDPAHLHDNAPAMVGQPIVDPAGYHEPACGAPQVVVTGGVYAPAPVYDIATRTGAIIPVNRDNPSTELDDLVVGFFQLGTKLYDPVTGANVANGICWAYKPVRFRPQWPNNAPHLIIASLQGTGAIDPV